MFLGESGLFFTWCLIKPQTGKLLKESDKEIGHKKTVTSLTKSSDGSHFITGSLDKSAKVLLRSLIPPSPTHACKHIWLIDQNLWFNCFQFQLWDTRTLTLIKTYVTERPVNAVTMSPLLDHVCVYMWAAKVAFPDFCSWDICLMLDCLICC